MGHTAPSAPLAQRSPKAQRCPPLADSDRLLRDCWDNTFCGKEGLKISRTAITEKLIILQEEVFQNGLRWASCTMGPITAHGREGAQTCREQLPWDGSSARDCGSGQAVVLKTSCFMALHVGLEKKPSAFRSEL